MIAVIQNAGDLQKTFKGTFAIAQPLNVGDLLIGFQSEAKAFRNAFSPIEQRGLRGHAIETVIDFDGCELFGVKGKHFTIGKLFRVKAALPLFVGVSGSANEKFARGRDRGGLLGN